MNILDLISFYNDVVEMVSTMAVEHKFILKISRKMFVINAWEIRKSYPFAH